MTSHYASNTPKPPKPAYSGEGASHGIVGRDRQPRLRKWSPHMHAGSRSWRSGGIWVICLLLAPLVIGFVWPVEPAVADPTVGPTITVGSRLGAVAVDESVHRIYVIDEKTGAVFAIDGNTNQVVGSLAVPARNSFIHGVAADPATRRVYFTTDTGVVVIDGPSLGVITTLASGTLFYPSLAVTTATGRVFALRPAVPGGAATPLTLFAFDANGTQAGTLALRNAASNLGSYTP